MVDILTFTPLVPVLFLGFMLGYVVAQRRRNRLSRAFVLLFSNMFVLMLLEFLLFFPIHPVLTLILNRITMLQFLLLGIGFLYFVYAATGRPSDRLFYGIEAISFASCIASLFFDPVTFTPAMDGITRIAIIKPVLLLLMMPGEILSTWVAMRLCCRGMRLLPERDQRQQMSLLFWGTICSTVYGVLILTLGPMIINVEASIHLSGLALLVHAIFVFRAVIRHHFLSIDIEQVESVSRILFDHVREGVVLLDNRGSPTQMNTAAHKILGMEAQETTQLNLGGFFSGYRSDELFEERRVVIRLDGRERILLMSQYPIRQPHSTLGMIVLMRDITNQTRLEMELSKAHQLESLGILAGGIAHDFNNFLTSITATFGLLKVSVTADPELVEIVSDGETAALNAAKLTQQLVTFAKGGVPIKESVPVRTMIEETVRFSLRGTAVSFTLDMADGVWPVNADKEQLSQVFHNLAINAVQAMPNGGCIAIVVRNRTLAMLERPPLSPGNYVEIRMRDSGTGIAPEIMAKIFDPYFTTKTAGSGLGLTTVYSIMKRHGGHIFVSSRVGSGTASGTEIGTEMELYIPASAMAPPGPTAARTVSPPLVRGDGCVLVMDDEPTVLLALSKLLESMGFTVEKTADGEEAIRLYDSPGRGAGFYRAVIADLTVPGGQGGKELAQKLLSREPGLRIIVSSGYSNDPIMANYRDFGFCGILKKPYDITALSDVLKSVLGSG